MRFSKVYYIFLIIILTQIILVGFSISSPSEPEPKVPTPTPSPPVRTPLKIRAAIPYWDQVMGLESFKTNAELIDYVSVFWYYLNDEGNIEKYDYAFEDTSIIDFAHENGILVSAVITNLPEYGTWDSERVENVLSSSSKTDKHIEDIRELLKEMDFDGVTIDYESVDSSERKNFSTFIHRLTQALEKDGKYVEVALHPKRGVASDSRYNFQDWAALGTNSARLYIMAYEEHDNEAEPGPAASTPWVKQIISYAKKQNIPQARLFLGIPLYGYDWNSDSDDPARGLTFLQAQNLISDYEVAVDWNEKYESAHFHYDDSHEVWFENARSFQEKLKLVDRDVFSGITFWRLGGEDPEIWKIIRELR